MGRVKESVVEQVRALIAMLPAEAKGKCALCNETLTHIVTKIEVTAKAPLQTVCRELAAQVNEGAAPQDRVSEQAIRERVRAATTDKNLSGRSDQINRITPPPPPPVRVIREGVEIVPPPPPEPPIVTLDEEPDDDLPQFDPALDIDRNGNPLQPRTPEEHKREFDALAPIMIHLIEPIEAINKAPLPPANFYATIPEWLRRSLADIDKAVEYLTAIQHMHHEATK